MGELEAGCQETEARATCREPQCNIPPTEAETGEKEGSYPSFERDQDLLQWPGLNLCLLQMLYSAGCVP